AARADIPPYLRFGLAGCVTGTVLAGATAAYSGRSVATVAGMTIVVVATFVVVALATKLLTGDETFSFYHHVLAAAVSVTAFLVVVGAPVRVNLDLLVLGLVGHQAVGRLGCQATGCCHGRPAAWGIRYGPQPPGEGVTDHLVGVVLFPVQAVESLACAVIAAIGAIGIIRGWAPGAGLVWCAGAYAATRFVLERWRGDDDRRYLAGVSSPRWTSLGIVVVLAALSLVGVLPGAPFIVPLAGVLAIACTALVVARRHGPATAGGLLEPVHVHELAHVLDAGIAAEPVQGPPRLWQTSRGLVVSTEVQPDGDRAVRLYSLSHASHQLDERTAGRLARLILQLRHPDLDYVLLPGAAGVHHLLVVGTAASSVPVLDG
ncbi:MAG: phosphatidylglycerol---prolipoprotein diacylglyceryl transferase, partial [Actinomycetota bacterium]|nr:phosphatidylglycerol---prolipoprotein diacylglyceryl transferase [Actinomycetota bacterium]